MLKYDILQFLNEHPELTYNGVEWNLNDPRYKEKRVSLYQNLDEIVNCLDWLDKFYIPSSRKKNETSSYSLKHYVEKYLKKYISNGAFVTAYIFKNYDFKTEKDNPNLFIRLQPKPLKEHRLLYKDR